MNKYLSISATFVLLAWILPNSSEARKETKTVHNFSGEDAHDIKVVLEGYHTIDWHFGGFTYKWHFENFQFWHEGDNTTLKWRHPRDGDGNPAPIPFCQEVHIGWGYPGEARHKILNMFWTDEQQMAIHKSVVWNATARKHYWWPVHSKIRFHNSIQPDDSLLIPYRSATISDIHYAYSDEQIDPDSLNLENEYLNDVLLQYLPGNYTIGPGDSVTVDLPLPENEDVWIIVRYNCNAPGLPGSEGDTDSTDCVDFVEWRSITDCVYIPGDPNCNGIPAELPDAITMIGNYRGTVPHCYECECPPHGTFAPSADPNGNCVSDELPDVVSMIGIYRGTVQPASCDDCPGQGLLAPGRDGTLVVPSMKSKVKINKRNMEE